MAAQIFLNTINPVVMVELEPTDWLKKFFSRILFGLIPYQPWYPIHLLFC